jgi:predicted RecA/RadA family phage recombinase
MSEALFRQMTGQIQEIATGDVASGEVVWLEDGRAAVRDGLQAAASGDAVTYVTEGHFALASAAATTFSKGDPVFWDASANQAVAASVAIDGADDFYLGLAVKAKVNGDTTVLVDLNAIPFAQGVIQSFVYEFDCETGKDAAVHTLIPAKWNKRGLVILGCYGLVSEVYAGGDQDQGIVTIKDSEAAPNTLSTLTVSDGGGDAANDVVIGINPVIGVATGAAVKTVAAGKAVTGAVTQATAGAGAAGKMKVFVLAALLA